MLLNLVVLSIAVFNSVNANNQPQPPPPDVWNDLRITWNINPFTSGAFDELPLTEQNAIKDGWVLQKDCSEIIGKRYVKNDDLAAMVVFDNSGYIAGISTAVPKGQKHNFPSQDIQPFFNDEGDYFTLTAYFIDPDLVCSKKLRLDTATLGDRVVLKGGEKEISLPLTENDANRENFWTKGNCFPTMGLHYWANVYGDKLAEDIDKDEFFPLFLLFNRGRLNGFGWALNFPGLPSSRYEHPPPQVVSRFMNPAPKFFLDENQVGVLSTMHIYLDNAPLQNLC